MLQRTLAILLGFVLAASSIAQGATKAQVVDDAGFFSPTAVESANARLAELDERFGKQLRVETYAEIPADRRGRYTEANKRQFFQQWTVSRAQQAQLTGVMVLICRDPSSLQVEAGRQTVQSGALTAASVVAIRESLLGAFRKKDYDAGLAKAIDTFAAALEARAGKKNPGAAPSAAAAPSTPSTPSTPRAIPQPAPRSTPAPYNLPPANASPAPRSSGGIPFGGIFFFVIVLFVGLWIIRRLLGGGSRSAGYGQNYGGGGGGVYPPPHNVHTSTSAGGGSGFGTGFGSGLLGGLLGSWIGNRAFDHHNHSAHNASAPPGPGFNEPPPSDFSSSGSSDSFSGGGDFGGGGGDLSSGGDASSSGGGDF